MLEEKLRWTVPIGKDEGACVLYRHFPRDYPASLWEPWLSEAAHALLEVRKLAVYIGDLLLGDYVIVNPLLNVLRNTFKEAEFFLIVHPVPPVERLLANDHLCDRLCRTPLIRARLSSLSLYKKAWGPLGQAMGCVDLFVDTQRQFLPSLMMKRHFRYRRRIGASCKGLFSDWKMPEPDRQKVHETYQLLLPARRLGIPITPPLHRLSVPDRIREIAHRWWDREKLDGAVSIFPQSRESGALKNWIPSYFESLIRSLARSGRPILLFDDPARAEELRSLAHGEKGVHVPFLETGIAPEDEIFLSLALLEKVSANVAPDSGGAHLGAAAGAPTLVISPLTRLDRYAPFGDRVWALHVEAPCVPCESANGRHCGGARFCARAVTPDKIVESLEKEVWAS